MINRTGLWRASLAAVAIVFAANAAVAADDGGVHSFLSNLFGGAGQGGAAPASAPVYVPAAPAAPAARIPSPRRFARLHPVTIHRRKPVAVVAAAAPALPPAKPGKVSIFEDTTLRVGDAVMMDDGVKIFAGSRSWPYAKTDFVSLAQARDISRDTAKVLTALNDLPRT